MFTKAAKILAAMTAAIALVVLAAVLGRVYAAEPVMPAPAATSATPSVQVGTFTGEYVNGAPVYRLPAVNVTVSRTAALAKIEQEEGLAAAGKAPAAEHAANAAATAPERMLPDRNIALYVGLAALGTIVSIVLSFSVVAARRRKAARANVPRVWLPAQPSAPAIEPALAARREPIPVPPVSEPVSLTAMRAQEQRERRREARRRAAAAQADAA